MKKLQMFIRRRVRIAREFFNFTFQCNYTSMVNGMFPLWERTACLDSVGSGSHRQQAETDGTAVSTGVTFASPISSRNHPRKTT